MSKSVRTYPRPFPCSHCALIIGLIHRGADRITRLNVLRQGMEELQFRAFTMPAEIQGLAEVFSVVDLNDGSVMCASCLRPSVWSASQSALNDMSGRRNARTYGLGERTEAITKS